ncbi:MAG: formate/nitrite transporter family protein [Lachnospiraceae bacterium]|nr:formate/nitrite transporter family protein [Lachnospiraceae bacterium]
MEQAFTMMKFPREIVEHHIEASMDKVKMQKRKLAMMGFFAGMFIAYAAAASSVIIHDISNVGLARLLAGCIFPVGLMLIVFIGGELFTGDCLMIMGVLHKQYRIRSMVRVLAVVLPANLVGAVLLTWLVSMSGQWNYTGGLLGAFTIKVAMDKVSMPFMTAFISGLICNVFVCAAVLLMNASKDVTGKIWGCFFPIMAFIVSGYEHCVADMYFVPAGIFAMKNEAYVQKAIDTYGYTAEQLSGLDWGSFFLNNMLPVTLGNMVGGMVIMGAILYGIHGKTLKMDRPRKAHRYHERRYRHEHPGEHHAQAEHPGHKEHQTRSEHHGHREYHGHGEYHGHREHHSHGANHNH